MKRVVSLLKNPYKLFVYLAYKGYFDSLDDEKYLKRMYRGTIGKRLNLRTPKTFNEKLQWMKLYNRRPEYTMMVDKYLVRDYIREKLGEKYLIPLVGVWDSPEEINFDALPDQFVLKCNHNSGLGMYICKDKSKMDVAMVKQQLERGLAQDYYLTGREWTYKNVPRKIIAEQYMTDNGEDLADYIPVTSDPVEKTQVATNQGLTDYKFFCFNGYVDCVMVCIDRHINDTKFYFFDKEWKLKRLNTRGKNAPPDFTLRKPKCMDEMFHIAEILSKDIPFVRVDLYECGGQIYFGELTFFPDSGFDTNLLPETDAYFGSLIDLEQIDKRGEKL